MSDRAGSYVRSDYVVLHHRRLGGVWAIVEAGTPPVALHKGVVGDAEALIRGVMRSCGADLRLGRDEQEELFAHLCEQTLILAGDFNPKAGATVEFRPWLFGRLRFKVGDYYRAKLGRNGEKIAAGLTLEDVPERTVEDQPFGDEEAFLTQPGALSSLREALDDYRALLERDRRQEAA